MFRRSTPAPFDRARSAAFLSSGAIWITGATVGLQPSPLPAAVASVYVVLAGLALASSRARTARTLAVGWGCAVALVTLVLAPVGGPLALVAGLVFGTLCFALWAGSGFLLLHAFSGRSRARRP
jgi:hypothetical protein